MGSLFVLLAMAGCGGGSSSSAPPGTERSVHWVNNWGPILNGSEDDGPTRSQSAVLVLQGANPDGTDFTTTYNAPNVRPIAQSLGSSGSVKVGTFQLEARFYSRANSTGTLIGIARAVVSITSPVPVDSAGHPAPDFQLDTSAVAVDSITVPGHQSLRIYASAPLIFTAHPRGVTDHILALSPNLETVQITSGANNLSYSNGTMTGLNIGLSTLTVTARGITSAPATVRIDNLDRP